MDECQVAGKLIVGNRGEDSATKVEQDYGVATFRVGPLRDLTGRPLGTIYTVGTLVAAAMLMAALAVVVRGAKARL
jgi:hypothetical protein